MSSRYVEPGRARHRVELVNGREALIIPNRRQWFVLAFLPVWLAGWTAGGVAAMWQFAQTYEPFLALWLCGWAVGWVFVASTLAMQLAGRETLQVTGGDLTVTSGVGPVRRTWRYRGRSITGLTSWQVDRGVFGMGRGLERPFWLRPQSGAVRFDYGAETMFLAAGVDEPEGRTVAAWLAKRLPGAAG